MITAQTRRAVFWLTVLGFVAFLLLPLALVHGAPPPVDQVARWNAAKIRPEKSIALDKAVFLYQRNASRYEAVEKLRQNGVPAPIVFCLHYRESDNDFSKHLHEGSTLLHRTRDVPKGRLPAPAMPPFTWLQSAEDAYYVCDRLQTARWDDLQSALDKMESFNGFGYRGRGIWAPYLFSGTSGYARGKYVADGRYSATALDGQLGCVAILKRMAERGISVPFAR